MFLFQENKELFPLFSSQSALTAWVPRGLQLKAKRQFSLSAFPTPASLLSRHAPNWPFSTFLFVHSPSSEKPANFPIMTITDEELLTKAKEVMANAYW